MRREKQNLNVISIHVNHDIWIHFDLSYEYFTIAARVLNTKGLCAKSPLFSKNKIILDKAIKQGVLFWRVTKFSQVIIKLMYDIIKESQCFDRNNGGLCTGFNRVSTTQNTHA